MLQQLGRFGTVGIIATLLHLCAAFFAERVLQMPPQGANLIGFLMAFAFSFGGHMKFTFNAQGPASSYLLRFFAMSGLGFLISSSIVYIITTSLGMSFLLAMAVVAICVPLSTFVVAKYWTFASHQHDSDPVHQYVLIGIFVQIAAYFLFMSLGNVNHDTGWYLVATPKWMAGAELYRDIIEVNPPWNFYLTVPVIWLSRLTGFSPEDAHFAFMALLTFISLAWSWRILIRVESLLKRDKVIAIQLVLMSLFLVTMHQTGQREHVFILFILPYLTSVYAACMGVVYSTRMRVFLALFAILGILIKPFFCFIPFCVSVAEAMIRRRLWLLFRLENWIMVIGCILYVIFVRVVHAPFFEELLPISFAIYSGNGLSIFGVIRGMPIYVMLLLLLVVCLISFKKSHPKASLIFAAAAIGGALAYYVQFTGYRYQSYPFFVFALVFCAFAFFSRGAGNATRVIIFLLTVALVWSAPPKHRFISKWRDDVIQHTQGLEAGQSVMMMSTNLHGSFPVIPNENLHWASRYPAQWFIPGSIAKLIDADCEKAPDYCAQYYDILDIIRRANTQDIITNNVQAIIVDNRKRKSYIRDPDFDYITFMMQDPEFAAVFKDFEVYAENKRFKSWRRKAQ